MNLENLDLLISTLESLPKKKFNMRYVYSTNGSPDDRHREGCHTAACIAGYVNILRECPEESSIGMAGRWLGLNPGAYAKLFIPDQPDYRRLTLPVAIAVLKHLRTTGKIDWDRALLLHQTEPAR